MCVGPFAPPKPPAPPPLPPLPPPQAPPPTLVSPSVIEARLQDRRRAALASNKTVLTSAQGLIDSEPDTAKKSLLGI